MIRVQLCNIGYQQDVAQPLLCCSSCTVEVALTAGMLTGRNGETEEDGGGREDTTQGADLSSINAMMSTVMNAGQLNGGGDSASTTPTKTSTKSPTANRTGRRNQVRAWVDTHPRAAAVQYHSLNSNVNPYPLHSNVHSYHSVPVNAIENTTQTAVSTTLYSLLYAVLCNGNANGTDNLKVVGSIPRQGTAVVRLTRYLSELLQYICSSIN